jgi:hypothetical protein
VRLLRVSLRVRLLVAVAIAVGALATSCGGDAPAPQAPKAAEATPSWADVFDGAPDLYVVLRPRALKRDALYGTFFKALMRAAQARGVARGDTMVQAVEGADELIVGLNKGLDAALVLRGVPASVDPQAVTDAEGRALFAPTNERARVPEYELVDRRNAGVGALFVLPERTWAFALGGARARARAAFAKPMNRPKPEVDARALVVVRAAGGMTRALEAYPRLSVLAKRLASATISLEPGKGGVVVALTYDDAGAVAWAEMHAKRLVEDLAREEKYAWLRDAKVAYEGSTLFVRVAVPPRLLEELPNVSGADLGIP